MSVIRNKINKGLCNNFKKSQDSSKFSKFYFFTCYAPILSEYFDVAVSSKIPSD